MNSTKLNAPPSATDAAIKASCLGFANMGLANTFLASQFACIELLKKSITGFDILPVTKIKNLAGLGWIRERTRQNHNSIKRNN